MYKKAYFLFNINAEYGGNLIESFKQLSIKLNEIGIETIYVLPLEMKEKKWCIELNPTFIDFGFKGLKHFSSKLKEDCIVHLNFFNNNMMLALKLGAINKNIKFIFHLHMRLEYDIYHDGGIKNKVKQIILPKIFKDVVMISASPAVYEDLKRNYPNQSICNITNAICLDRIKGKRKNTDNNEALVFGSSPHIKGTDIAIDAWKNSEEINNKITLRVITHDKSQIDEIIGNNKYSIIVDKPNKNVSELYYKSNIFISPSRSEAFCYAVCEAAYCGCIVIASNILGQNTMKDIPGIIWYEPNNYNELTKAILKALDNYRVDVNKVRDYIKMNYSIEFWVEKMMKIYKNINEIKK